MMFLPTNLSTPVINPIERERISSGRPESRFEIAQRSHSESRLNAAILTSVDEEATRSQHGGPQVVQNTVSTIRRTLSRMLITTGERIDPEAA